MLEGGGVGRAVFVFRRFYFFAGFIGRDNPFKSAVFGHGAEEEVCVAGEDRESSAKKIRGGHRVGFLGFASLDQFNHLVEMRVGRTYAGDRGRILLDEASERDVFEIGWDTDFNNGFGLVFFRRIELREARAKNVRLPVVSAGGDGTLLDLIRNEPDFGPVTFRRVAEENDLQKRLVGLELDRMMELGNERAQFFKKGNAYLLEVLFGAAGGGIAGVDGAKVGDVPVEPDRPGLRGNLPFRSAEENADVAVINGGDARRHGFGFERMINGGENDGVIGNVNDGAATGEVGDDFVFLGARTSAG